MAESPAEKIIAFIDIGTNSARLMIIRLNTNFSYTVLRSQKETVRLGQGEFLSNVINDSAINRAVIVCRQFAETAKSFGAEEIIAVATSAAREASNKEYFLEKIKEESGLSVDIISGTEEARLIYLGVSSGIDIKGDKYFFIDIGGGSTEIIIGDQSDCYILESLKLGAIRTTGRFFPDNYSGTVSAEHFLEIQKHVLRNYAYSLNSIKKYNLKGAVGSSGTVQALVGIKNRLWGIKKEGSADDSITTNELYEVIDYLCKKNLDERRQVLGMNPERADIIIAGSIILYTILKETKLKEIKASDRSLRDGLLADYLSRLPGFLHEGEISVRKRSIIHLGKSCGVCEEHIENVTRLSFNLFDSAKLVLLHDFDERERELLEYSAYLHDAGHFISFSQHQNHSYYVIKNTPLIGFTENEIEIIALSARHHRKKAPKQSDSKIKKLSPEDKRAVLYLSLFLRMAEHMERSHDGRIKEAFFAKKDDDFILNIKSLCECSLELWSLEEDARIFEDIFGKKLFFNVSVIQE